MLFLPAVGHALLPAVGFALLPAVGPALSFIIAPDLRVSSRCPRTLVCVTSFFSSLARRLWSCL